MSTQTYISNIERTVNKYDLLYLLTQFNEKMMIKQQKLIEEAKKINWRKEGF